MLPNLQFTCNAEDAKGEDNSETQMFRAMHREALAEYRKQTHNNVQVEKFGGGIGNIITVWLFGSKIMPGSALWHWTIVGDLPAATFPSRAGDAPRDALAEYISIMRQWAVAVANGHSLDGVWPVNAEPTKEMADSLEQRLRFIEKEILPCSQNGLPPFDIHRPG